MNVVASAVSVTVADVAASSRFFTTCLGFREVVVKDGFVHLVRDDAACDIVLTERDPELPAEPSWGRAEVMVCLSVTGLAAEQERLRAAGARIAVPLRQEPWGEQVLHLSDPNGVVVQLVEWLPPAGA
ncbi:VOC family protein [Nonomuraea endophytica]|uniref:VOC family protein n=1 Tax=Nonomuraea endophytica TaxID=714136 RepID=UPI0037C8F7A6